MRPRPPAGTFAPLMLRVGIFFGGPSREREISFAGGRTVFDNLDKALFAAVPIFVDSLGNFIRLDWQYLYKGTIRDFYPAPGLVPQFAPPEAADEPWQVYIESLGALTHHEQDTLARAVGEPIQPRDFRALFDFAFLTLHGPYGEDGAIQGVLDWAGIPYSGAGLLPSAIGIDKIAQKQLLQRMGFATPDFRTVGLDEWNTPGARPALLARLQAEIGLPFVVKAPHQGSSIGVSVVQDEASFTTAINRAFFQLELTAEEWSAHSAEQKKHFARALADIRSGIGLPVQLGEDGPIIHHPAALAGALDAAFSATETVRLLALTDAETTVLVERFVQGREFSCIVIEKPDGEPLALPPTEIIKGQEVFDYRAKYLPGMARKVTPIELPAADIQRIRQQCQELFRAFQFSVYARLDGFYTAEGDIFLNDPNTTSGMLPASFFFHQAAEIGLNPSQLITTIIRTSLAARARNGKKAHALRTQLARLDAALADKHAAGDQRIPVAVVLGGYSSERHISVESGRNIYEKLASSAKYRPVPVFLSGSNADWRLHVLPINLLLKDNADDIRDQILHAEDGHGHHPVLDAIAADAAPITTQFAGQTQRAPRRISLDELAQEVKAVFIALHGRPGEDGALQRELERVGLPYNGSGANASAVTINKYVTNQTLRQNGIRVADHQLVTRAAWETDAEAFYAEIERNFGYPLIAKPADDGCSSAVKKLDNRAELVAFTRLIFRETLPLPAAECATLKLSRGEEFPQKTEFVIETLIGPEGARHFLEITGGLLTHYLPDGGIAYEIFEASEALATGSVLSLEEKFLAGEGQNITPARYAPESAERQRISEEVKRELRRVAEILHVEGYARIDAFVRVRDSGAVEVIIIEVNSLPGMTPATCIFHQTALAGYSPYEFIDQILEFGAHRLTASRT